MSAKETTTRPRISGSGNNNRNNNNNNNNSHPNLATVGSPLENGTSHRTPSSVWNDGSIPASVFPGRETNSQRLSAEGTAAAAPRSAAAISRGGAAAEAAAPQSPLKTAKTIVPLQRPLLRNNNNNNDDVHSSTNTRNHSSSLLPEAALVTATAVVEPRLAELRQALGALRAANWVHPAQQQDEEHPRRNNNINNAPAGKGRAVDATVYKPLFDTLADLLHLILTHPRTAVAENWFDKDLWRALYECIKHAEQRLDRFLKSVSAGASSPSSFNASPLSQEPRGSTEAGGLWHLEAVLRDIDSAWDRFDAMYGLAHRFLERCSHLVSPKANSSYGRKLMYSILSHIGDVQRYHAKCGLKTLSVLSGEKLKIHELSATAKRLASSFSGTSSSPPPVVLKLQSALFRACKNYSAAVSSYQAVIAIHPRKGNGWNQLALCYEERQDVFYAAYAYVRAMTAPERFPLATENFNKIFRKNFPFADDPMSQFEEVALKILETLECLRLERLASLEHQLSAGQGSQKKPLPTREEWDALAGRRLRDCLSAFLERPSWFLPNRMLERFAVLLSLYAPLFIRQPSSTADLRRSQTQSSEDRGTTESSPPQQQPFGAVAMVERLLYTWIVALCDGLCGPASDHTADVQESIAVALEITLRLMSYHRVLPTLLGFSMPRPSVALPPPPPPLPPPAPIAVAGAPPAYAAHIAFLAPPPPPPRTLSIADALSQVLQQSKWLSLRLVGSKERLDEATLRSAALPEDRELEGLVAAAADPSPGLDKRDAQESFEKQNHGNADDRLTAASTSSTLDEYHRGDKGSTASNTAVTSIRCIRLRQQLASALADSPTFGSRAQQADDSAASPVTPATTNANTIGKHPTENRTAADATFSSSSASLDLIVRSSLKTTVGLPPPPPPQAPISPVSAGSAQLSSASSYWDGGCATFPDIFSIWGEAAATGATGGEATHKTTTATHWDAYENIPRDRLQADVWNVSPPHHRPPNNSTTTCTSITAERMVLSVMDEDDDDEEDDDVVVYRPSALELEMWASISSPSSPSWPSPHGPEEPPRINGTVLHRQTQEQQSASSPSTGSSIVEGNHAVGTTVGFVTQPLLSSAAAVSTASKMPPCWN